jgi:uncharacterized protein (DUF983 family)
MLPHSDFGDPECCGCLYGIVGDGEAEIVCNECGLVIRTVPAADLQRTLDEMELTLSVCSELCPKCGKVNLFPGFSRMVLYTCKECGETIVSG